MLAILKATGIMGTIQSRVAVIAARHSVVVAVVKGLIAAAGIIGRIRRPGVATVGVASHQPVAVRGTSGE